MAKGYYQLGNEWLGRASGLHSSPTQSQYSNYSRALGRDYSVGEYVPFYHNTYKTSTASGRAQREADRAEAENVRRYYEILSGYKGLLDSGVSETASAYNKAMSGMLQNLTGRGLAGTTVLTNAQMRNAVNSANAQQQQYAKNLLAMLQFMERRNTGTGQLTL